MPDLIPPETLERLRAGRCVVLIGSDDPGFTTLALHRFGIVDVAPATNGLLAVEMDPWRFTRGIRQQPISESPRRTEQDSREMNAWLEVTREIVRHVDHSAEDRLWKLIQRWGEELHEKRSMQDPVVARECLAEARAAVGA